MVRDWVRDIDNKVSEVYDMSHYVYSHTLENTTTRKEFAQYVVQKYPHFAPYCFAFYDNKSVDYVVKMILQKEF